jgi:hypothetical protein
VTRNFAIAHGDAGEPEEEWEAAAASLERDLWSSLYSDEVDLAALAMRAEWVSAAHEAAGDGRPAPPHRATVGDSEMLTRPRHLWWSEYHRPRADERIREREDST